MHANRTFLNRFFATARMSTKEQSYFGFVDLCRVYILRGVSLAAMLGIWHMLMAQGADTDGFTRDQMLTYTLLSSALYPLLNVRTQASSWMHDGQMLGLYLRPDGLFTQIAAHTLGGWGMHLLFFAIPVLILGGLFGLSIIPATPWFFLSLCLTVIQGFAMDFLFLCLSIRLHNLEWVMHTMREALTVVLTGALIPFAALPWGIGDWLALSPFGTLAGAPLALFVGIDSPARLIPAQLLWTIALWPLAIACFKRSTERMVSYGG